MKNSKPLRIQSNLFRLRKESKFTQEEIAKKIGCTAKTYANYERNPDDERYQKPYIDHLISLADMFNVSTDYILGRSNCRSVENDYINKKLGISDEAINGLQELTSKDEDMVLKNAYMMNTTGKSYRMFSKLNLDVINVLLSNHDIFSRWIESFIDYAFSFQFSVPVMADSKGNWKKITSKIALASSEDNLDDISPSLDDMSSLIESAAKDRMIKAVDDLGSEYIRYLLGQGIIDATSLLVNAYKKRV